MNAFLFLLVLIAASGAADDDAGDARAARFAHEVNMRLAVPAAERAEYAQRLRDALVAAELREAGPEYYLLVDRSPVVQAAFVYLISTHLTALGLWWLFAGFESATGTFGFAPLPSGQAGTGLMLLALVAFGLKAGVMPLHVWLPGAHAVAPTHVSAMLSGVVLKMGIYGIVRTASVIPDLPRGVGALASSWPRRPKRMRSLYSRAGIEPRPEGSWPGA